VREKQRNMFFGRILRDQAGDKTLKNLSISNNAQLVIQVLAEPEYLDPNTIILLACRRNLADHTYNQKVEFKFTFPEKDVPKIPELAAQCKIHLGLAPTDRVSIAKYIPHAFEWRWLNPDEVIVEKKGKKSKTEIKFAASEADLRKAPFLLKDGDIIGIRVDTEAGAEADDFQTEADAIAKEDFRIE